MDFINDKLIFQIIVVIGCLLALKVAKKVFRIVLFLVIITTVVYMAIPWVSEYGG